MTSEYSALQLLGIIGGYLGIMIVAAKIKTPKE